jgi:hypothetical protein
MTCKSAGSGVTSTSIFGDRGVTLTKHVYARNISGNGLTSVPKRGRSWHSTFRFIMALLLLSTFINVVIADPAADLKITVAKLQAQVQSLTTDDHAAYAKLQSTLAATNQGQGVLAVVGVTTVKAGTSGSIPITLIPGQFLPTDVQFDVLIPTGVVFVSAIAGPSSTAANKLVQSAPVTGGVRIIVFGLNQTPLTQGVVVTLTLTAGSSIAKILYPISIINPAASNLNGQALPFCVTSGIVGVQ